MCLSFKKLLTLCLVATGILSAKAANYAWPSNWEGVMLQGFYWDSYDDTKWSNLESQADELSKYFKLIWVPNSGNCGGGKSMGYMPIYWFTNHNSSFGTENALRSMIKTFKAKGTGIIADVVINHRNGVSNWTDFPTEQWNGQTWKIGTDGICSNDEVRNASGQATPTGAPDTGENFDGARDLDHTNANVQNNAKNYCKCLLEDFGYAGFRYDMVKGYGGQYTKIYNEYSKPTYSVGEYWDGNYDAVARWIESTGRQSAAFDFPGKYAINEAFASNDMTKLVWMANGSNPQPAGMIHYGYTQYAVTFIDNHDTYRDNSKFSSSRVVAANAFILCSPGVPCVFLPHYKNNKAAIQKLIDIRNAVGLHNNSAVKVLQTDRSCYMAEVTGSKGTLVVKIGDSMASPAGYTDADIKASGDGYCVWTKAAVQGGGGGGQGGGTTTVTMPSALYILGNIEGAQWDTSAGISMTKEGNKFVAKNVTLTPASNETNCYFTFVTALGADWNAVNGGGNRYGAASQNAPVSAGGSATMKEFVVDVDASSANSWEVPAGTYDITADFESMTVTVNVAGQGGGGGGTVTVNMPSSLYVLGNIEGAQWDTTAGISMTKTGNTFVATNVTLTPASNETKCYFTFVSALGADWGAVNGGGNRYGAVSQNAPLSVGGSAAMKEFVVDVDASSANSWEVPAGTYDITADFESMTVKINTAGTIGVADVANDSVDTPKYFNLQGMPVSLPEKGNIYIVVRGNKASKEYI